MRRKRQKRISSWEQTKYDRFMPNQKKCREHQVIEKQINGTHEVYTFRENGVPVLLFSFIIFAL